MRFSAEDPNDAPTVRIQVGRWTTFTGFWAITQRNVEYVLQAEAGVPPPQAHVVLDEILRLLETLPESPFVNDLIVALPAGLRSRTEPVIVGYLHNGVASILAVALALILGVEMRVFVRWRSSALRQRRGHCPRCAYDLRHDLATGCPACGWNRSAANL